MENMKNVFVVLAWILAVGFGGAAIVAAVTTLVMAVVRDEQARKPRRPEIGSDLESLFGPDQA